jgi:hypothetical protein
VLAHRKFKPGGKGVTMKRIYRIRIVVVVIQTVDGVIVLIWI